MNAVIVTVWLLISQSTQTYSQQLVVVAQTPTKEDCTSLLERVNDTFVEKRKSPMGKEEYVYARQHLRCFETRIVK